MFDDCPLRSLHFAMDALDVSRRDIDPGALGDELASESQSFGGPVRPSHGCLFRSLMLAGRAEAPLAPRATRALVVRDRLHIFARRDRWRTHTGTQPAKGARRQARRLQVEYALSAARGGPAHADRACLVSGLARIGIERGKRKLVHRVVVHGQEDLTRFDGMGNESARAHRRAL
jgi:hypothetical protein